ncbi:MAG: hypothetical protein WBA13_15220 [Microcoleaceae cyanobacterium]
MISNTISKGDAAPICDRLEGIAQRNISRRNIIIVFICENINHQTIGGRVEFKRTNICGGSNLSVKLSAPLIGGEAVGIAACINSGTTGE